MFRLGRVIYHPVSGSGRQVTVQRARHTSLCLSDFTAAPPAPGWTALPEARAGDAQRALRGERGGLDMSL